ncbi:hypothetical protein ACQPW1_10335 [Nocardia sp. CA-128927]|uniref:hypothetical protein n=1 Tax=Nocardia sp. CA-128927 TaxID=3239975 RepID=UPI003D954640
MSLTVWADEPKVATAFASNDWTTAWIEHETTDRIDGWCWMNEWYLIVAEIIDALYGDHGDPETVYAESRIRAIEHTVSHGVTLTYQLLADQYGCIKGMSLRLESSKGVTLASVDCLSGDDITYLDETWSPTDIRTHDTVLRGVLQALEAEFKRLADVFGY